MRTVKIVCGIVLLVDEVLICRRQIDYTPGTYWEFPGPRIEEGEDYRVALETHMKSQFNYEITVEDYYTSFKHPYADIMIELIAFWCKGEKRELQSVDHDQIAWVKYSDLLNYKLTTADEAIAKQLIQQLDNKLKNFNE